MPITFEVIGCGRIAQRHAKHIQSVGKLLAVCDIDKEKADALALEHNARSYTSIDDLLRVESSVDVLAICTPNGLHAEHTIQSIESWKARVV